MVCFAVCARDDAWHFSFDEHEIRCEMSGQVAGGRDSGRRQHRGRSGASVRPGSSTLDEIPMHDEGHGMVVGSRTEMITAECCSGAEYAFLYMCVCV